MSCEDSLSESILVSNEEDRHKEPVEVPMLLDEVESLQEDMQKCIEKRETLSLESKLGRIKEILTKVNKKLAEEKFFLSNMKVSLSQSLTQVESNFTEKEMKEKARKLVTQQKRLLNAFKVQKSITSKIQEKDDDSKVCREESSQKKNDKRSFKKTQPNEIVNKSILNVERIQGSELNAEETQKTRQASFVITDRYTSSKDPCAPSKIIADSQKPTGRPSYLQEHEQYIATNSQSTVKDQTVFQCSGNQIVPIYQTPASAKPHSNVMIIKVNPQFASQSQLLNQNSFDVQKLCESLQKPPLLTDLKQFKTTLKIDATKKQSLKRKRPAKKLMQQEDAVLNDNTKINNTKGLCPLDKNGSSEAMTTIISEKTPLPSLNAIHFQEDDDQSLSLSSIKFLVTIKDEELLPSSQFMPKDFWDSNWNSEEYKIDNNMLMKLDFID